MQIKPYRRIIVATSLLWSANAIADSTTPNPTPPSAAPSASSSTQISIAPSNNQLTMAHSLFKDSDYQHLQNDSNVLQSLTFDN